MNVFALAAFIGAGAVFVELTRMGIGSYDPHNPSLTLSELAALRPSSLLRFRVTIWFSSTMHSFAIYGFLLTRVAHPWLLGVSWTLTLITSALVAVVPARGTTLKLHEALAMMMAFGMVVLVSSLLVSLSGTYAELELGLWIVGASMGILAFRRIHRPLLYEFISVYAVHLAIVVAVVAKIG